MVLKIIGHMPLSLIVTAFAPCADTRDTLTPLLAGDIDTALLLIDLGQGKNRMADRPCAGVQTGRDVARTWIPR